MTISVGLLAVLAGGLLAAGLAGLVVPPRPRLGPRVRPYTIGAQVAGGRTPDSVAIHTNGTGLDSWTVLRLVGPPLRAISNRVVRFADRNDDEMLRQRLRQSGLALTVEEYRMRVVFYALAFAAVGVLFGGLVMRSPAMTVLLGICGLVVGATRWRGKLDGAITERRERTRLELYTVNQLLAMHVRSGAGPVQAVQRLVNRANGVVVDELAETLGWMQRGMSEADAFRRAADLTPEPSAARTYKLFAASAERGSDLGGALRALSEDLRDARREELRRLATKRRAGMLVPIIAVLAPVMLLFIAAPIPSMLFGNR